MPSSRLQRLVTVDNTSPSLHVDYSPAAAQDRGNTLPDLLASLKHFDLTGSVRRKENVKGVGRGYYDVHEGILFAAQWQSCSESGNKTLSGPYVS